MGGSSLGKKWPAPACVMTAQRSVWWPLRNHENVNKTTERDAINWGWEPARNPSGSLLLSLHVPRSPAGGAGGTCQERSLIPSYPASQNLLSWPISRDRETPPAGVPPQLSGHRWVSPQPESPSARTSPPPPCSSPQDRSHNHLPAAGSESPRCTYGNQM